MLGEEFEEDLDLETAGLKPPIFPQPFLPSPYQLQSLLGGGGGSKRPLPKLVRATLPQFRNFGLGTGSRTPPTAGTSSSTLQLQAPSFSLTRQLLEEPPYSQSSGTTTTTSAAGRIRIRERIKHRRSLQRHGPGAASGNAGETRSGDGNGDGGELGASHKCRICGKSYVHLRSLNDHLKVRKRTSRIASVHVYVLFLYRIGKQSFQ